MIPAAGIFPWQRDGWRKAISLLEQDRLPHALMLTGPAEIGKHRFAMALAQRVLCLAPVSGESCTACKACKLFLAATHPDFLLVEPEAEGKAIKVDQVRALAEFATRTASLGAYRAIVVCPGEAMNINAANAFLKTLEEPGDGVVILLVVHQPGRILPTIRSRCRIFPFSLPGREDVAGWLRNNGDTSRDIDQVMALSGGRPLRGQRLLETDLWNQLQLFGETLESLASNTLPVLDAARVLQGFSSADAMEWFQYLVYEKLKAIAVDEPLLCQRMFRFLDRLNLARQRLISTANPNPQLVWEEVLMDWKSMLDLSNNQTGK